MNPILIVFGLLGALFAMGGSSSSGATESDAESSAQPTPVSDTDDDGETEGDGGHGSGHDHGGSHGGGTEKAFVDITEFGTHHGTSSHTHEDSLEGGRTPITTEAHVAYNGLRDFLGLDPVSLDEVGEWAFAEGLTNNKEAYGDDIPGVGLYYSMQGAKVGWITDDAFDPQIVADIQLAAREEETGEVMTMVGAYGLEGFDTYLRDNGLVDEFVNTLKMEPHYGGWMHGRVHGWLDFEDASGKDVAIAHDLNHLTVLSHDQTQPFMNDTFDWPQWPALDVPQADVANYFQSMVTLGDPHGQGIVEGSVVKAAIEAPEGEALMASLAVDQAHSDEASLEKDQDDLALEAF